MGKVIPRDAPCTFAGVFNIHRIVDKAAVLVDKEARALTEIRGLDGNVVFNKIAVHCGSVSAPVVAFPDIPCNVVLRIGIVCAARPLSFCHLYRVIVAGKAAAALHAHCVAVERRVFGTGVVAVFRPVRVVFARTDKVEVCCVEKRTVRADAAIQRHVIHIIRTSTFESHSEIVVPEAFRERRDNDLACILGRAQLDEDRIDPICSIFVEPREFILQRSVDLLDGGAAGHSAELRAAHCDHIFAAFARPEAGAVAVKPGLLHCLAVMRDRAAAGAAWHLDIDPPARIIHSENDLIARAVDPDGRVEFGLARIYRLRLRREAEQRELRHAHRVNDLEGLAVQIGRRCGIEACVIVGNEVGRLCALLVVVIERLVLAHGIAAHPERAICGILQLEGLVPRRVGLDEVIRRHEPGASAVVPDIGHIIAEHVIAGIVGDLPCIFETAHRRDIDRAAVVFKGRSNALCAAADIAIAQVDIPGNVVVLIRIVSAEQPPVPFPDHGFVIPLEGASVRIHLSGAIERGVGRFAVGQRYHVLARTGKVDILDNKQVVVRSNAAFDRGLGAAVRCAAAQVHDLAAGVGSLRRDHDRALIGLRGKLDIVPLRILGFLLHDRCKLRVQLLEGIDLAGLDRRLNRCFPRDIAADLVFCSVQLEGRGDLPRTDICAVETKPVVGPAVLVVHLPPRRVRVAGRALGR